MIVKILTFLLNLFFKKLDITKGEGADKTIYLRRWYLWRSKRGQVFLHQFFRSDDDPDPHDHPWNFRTLVLKGAYTDQQYRFVPWAPDSPMASKPYDGRKGFRYFAGNERVRWYAKRDATHIHRVILDTDKKGLFKQVWTLVLTTGYERKWNFVTQDEIVYWRQYLNQWDGEEI